MQIKKIGILKMLGQVMFLVLIVLWLRKKTSWCRLQLYKLDNTDFNAVQNHCVVPDNDVVVDTGAILTLMFTLPTAADKFTTYLAILVGEGIEGLKNLLQQEGVAAYKGINHSEKGQLNYPLFYNALQAKLIK